MLQIPFYTPHLNCIWVGMWSGVCYSTTIMVALRWSKNFDDMDYRRNMTKVCAVGCHAVWIKLCSAGMYGAGCASMHRQWRACTRWHATTVFGKCQAGGVVVHLGLILRGDGDHHNYVPSMQYCRVCVMHGVDVTCTNITFNSMCVCWGYGLTFCYGTLQAVGYGIGPVMLAGAAATYFWIKFQHRAAKKFVDLPANVKLKKIHKFEAASDVEQLARVMRQFDADGMIIPENADLGENIIKVDDWVGMGWVGSSGVEQPQIVGIHL